MRLLFPIKSEPGVVYKSVAYKKGKRIERSFVHEEITFHHDFLLYLPQVSLGQYCQKNVVKGGGVQ